MHILECLLFVIAAAPTPDWLGLGTFGTDLCPPGSVKIDTEAECYAAGDKLGDSSPMREYYARANTPKGMSIARFLKGCFLSTGMPSSGAKYPMVKFNWHPTGAATNAYSQPICAGACSPVCMCVCVRITVHQ